MPMTSVTAMTATASAPLSQKSESQNALDCFSDESRTVEQKLREAFDSLYTELVPPEMQNAIEMEILKESIAQQEQTEADKRFGLFRIRENNEDRYYLNEFIQQLLAGAYRYRLYSQNKLSSEPKRFADALLGSVPITVIDYENLAERFEDEPKILSVMDFDLDDGTVSVTDADGSRVYSLQSVSAAAYQVHRSRQLTAEKKAEVFADYLDGKEIEQAPLVPEM